MIQKDVLKKIILEQQKMFVGDFVMREKMKDLKNKSKSDSIIIISGVRRCGKSVLLNLFRKKQKEQSYYLNFDDERLHNFELNDFEKLYEVFVELFGEEKTFYFDEIQNIKGWERFIRRLYDYGNKIYITGSNANLLSRDLGTHLTGRYLQIELFPASFREFLDFKNVDFNKNDLHKRNKIVEFQKFFKEYLEKGGFFKYLQIDDRDFFNVLYDNILYRDIIAKYSLSYKKGIKDIFYYLISNASKEYSYTTLKIISNINSITTIKDYNSYLEDSYLLFSVNLYDKSLKRQLINPKKIYPIDTGLASSISFRFSEDYGRMLESVVFLELKRQGKEIYYHRKKAECDFVILDRLKIVEAIQISKSLSDIKTKEREVAGLLEAMKTYNLKKGLILTEDETDEFQRDGKKIKVLPVWKWLLR